MPDKEVWNVLLIAHHPEDVQVIERALASAPKLPARVRVVERVEDAITLLEQHDAPAPSLILFNSRLPSVMEAGLVDAFRRLRLIVPSPVLFFCAAANKTEIEEAYRGTASAYAVIPEDPRRFEALVRQVLAYWLTRVELPQRYHPRFPALDTG